MGNIIGKRESPLKLPRSEPSNAGEFSCQPAELMTILRDMNNISSSVITHASTFYHYEKAECTKEVIEQLKELIPKDATGRTPEWVATLSEKLRDPQYRFTAIRILLGRAILMRLDYCGDIESTLHPQEIVSYIKTSIATSRRAGYTEGKLKYLLRFLNYVTNIYQWISLL
jgi:hypothetical protein